MNTDSHTPPQTAATSADYQVLVDRSEALLARARALVPATDVARLESRVHDLDTDRHRMSCSDTTSQYVNIDNLFLVAGSNEIALVDQLRNSFTSDGWTRLPSVAEQQGQQQDPAGAYVQTLRGPDAYGLSISRGLNTDGSPILQLSVYSPCIGNPTDKPSTWGRG